MKIIPRGPLTHMCLPIAHLFMTAQVHMYTHVCIYTHTPLFKRLALTMLDSHVYQIKVTTSFYMSLNVNIIHKNYILGVGEVMQ